MTILGTVVRGKGEGRAVGYPTANLAYESATAPEDGVFVARTLVGTKVVRSLAIIGMWRLQNGLPSVETYLLDAGGDLYGQRLAVSLVKKLRDLEKFSDAPSLVARIKKDVEDARRYFSKQ